MNCCRGTSAPFQHTVQLDAPHHAIAAVSAERLRGERAAAIYTLIVTAKLNGVDPRAWLADVLRRIADHPASRLHELLPWSWSAAHRITVAA